MGQRQNQTPLRLVCSPRRPPDRTTAATGVVCFFPPGLGQVCVILWGGKYGCFFVSLLKKGFVFLHGFGCWVVLSGVVWLWVVWVALHGGCHVWKNGW